MSFGLTGVSEISRKAAYHEDFRGALNRLPKRCINSDVPVD